MLTGVRNLIEEKEKERKKAWGGGGGGYVAKSPDVIREGKVAVKKVTQPGIFWVSACTMPFTTCC